MLVEKLMIRDVHTVRPEDTLQEAARILWEHDCGCLPVLSDDGRVLGMLTDRDVCMAAYTTDRPLSAVRVAWAMSQGVHAVGPRDTVRQAEATMRRFQVRRLPVLGPDAHLLGILTLNDLARAADAGRGGDGVSPDEVERTLAVIGARPRGHRGEPLQ